MRWPGKTIRERPRVHYASRWCFLAVLLLWLLASGGCTPEHASGQLIPAQPEAVTTSARQSPDLDPWATPQVSAGDPMLPAGSVDQPTLLTDLVSTTTLPLSNLNINSTATVFQQAPSATAPLAQPPLTWPPAQGTFAKTPAQTAIITATPSPADLSAWTATPLLSPSFTPAPSEAATAADTPLPSPPTSCPTSGNGSFEGRLIDLINQERQNEGLFLLAAQPQLGEAARGHSEDMACNDYVSHTGSDGSNAGSRVTAQGYSFSSVGENIYAGGGSHNSPEQAFDSWMNSPGHKANMLSPDYIDIGVGYIYNPESQYGGYYTAIFAKP